MTLRGLLIAIATLLTLASASVAQEAKKPPLRSFMFAEGDRLDVFIPTFTTREPGLIILTSEDPRMNDDNGIHALVAAYSVLDPVAHPDRIDLCVMAMIGIGQTVDQQLSSDRCMARIYELPESGDPIQGIPAKVISDKVLKPDVERAVLIFGGDIAFMLTTGEYVFEAGVAEK